MMSGRYLWYVQMVFWGFLDVSKEQIRTGQLRQGQVRQGQARLWTGSDRTRQLKTAQIRMGPKTFWTPHFLEPNSLSDFQCHGGGQHQGEERAEVQDCHGEAGELGDHPKIFGTTFFWTQNFFRTQNLCLSKFFKTNIFLNQNFFRHKYFDQNLI